MRIVNKQEFYKMPEGTLFSEFKDYTFGHICVKNETIISEFRNNIPFDFFYTNVTYPYIESSDDIGYFDILEKMKNDNIEYPIDFCLNRDGKFDETQLYAIWSKKDIKNLIKILKNSLDFISN